MTQEQAQSTTQTIRVTGMGCTGCERTIAEGLGSLAGVVDVKADHKTGDVMVIHDAGAVTRETLEQELTKVGYPPANAS